MTGLHDWIGVQGQYIGALQMSVRAAIIFAAGVVLLRFAATRAFGKWSALDIILAVIIGSNLSRALTGSAPFLPTLTATAVLIVLHAALVKTAARWPAFGRWTKGRAVTLVSEGEIDEGAMKRCGIGRGDLRLALRASGYDNLDEIKSAALERNGDISIIGR